MISIQYFGLKACHAYGFPYIYDELTTTEKAPLYETEPDGIAELEKVLNFVQNDDYYPTFEDKSSYLICSIAGSQYFSNGNKRLAVTILLMFLMHNNALVLSDYHDLQRILFEHFPKHIWENNTSIKGEHSLFLYNLAVVLGDRTRWESDDFSTIKQSVAHMFRLVHVLVDRKDLH